MKYPFQAYAYTKADVNEAVRLATEELQAQLAEANAEVGRLRKLTLALSMERHVPAMRVAHEMHKQQEQATDDYMALVEKCDSAWNDAIEVAVSLSEKSSSEGGVAKSMAFFAKAEDQWVYKQACMDYAGAILALKK